MDFLTIDFSKIELKKMSIGEIKAVYNQLKTTDYYEEARKNAFSEFITDKAKKETDGNISKWRDKLLNEKKENEEDEDLLPALYKTTRDSLRRNLANWKNGENFPVFVRNLCEDDRSRNEYLDMLLYLDAHRDGNEVSIEIFNEVALKHGMEPLYVLDFVNFCIAIAIKIESKTGKNAYRTYCELLNDKQLEKVVKSRIAGKGQVTSVIQQDFDSIEEIGNINEVTKNGDIAAYQSVTTSVYKFAAKYAAEFGRCHLSRYYALASLLYGDDIDDEIGTKDKFYIFRGDSHGYANARETVRNMLNGNRYQQMLYLLGNALTVGCYMFVEEDENRHFTKKYIDEIANELDQMYNHQTINIYNKTPREFNEIMTRTKSLPRELLLLIILATMNKKTIKEYAGRYVKKEDIKTKIRDQINAMLKKCQLVSLDMKNSKSDFLVLLAIEKANYTEITKEDGDNEDDEYDEDGEGEYNVENFPYMDFLVNNFFNI